MKKLLLLMITLLLITVSVSAEGINLNNLRDDELISLYEQCEQEMINRDLMQPRFSQFADGSTPDGSWKLIKQIEDGGVVQYRYVDNIIFTFDNGHGSIHMEVDGLINEFDIMYSLAGNIITITYDDGKNVYGEYDYVVSEDFLTLTWRNSATAKMIFIRQ